MFPPKEQVLLHREWLIGSSTILHGIFDQVCRASLRLYPLVHAKRVVVVLLVLGPGLALALVLALALILGQRRTSFRGDLDRWRSQVVW